MKRQSVIRDILFTVLTFGLWNVYVQIRQIYDLNELLGREEYHFVKIVLLSILTLGLYFCYHEYKMSRQLYDLYYGKGSYPYRPYAYAFLTFLGLWFIVDSSQQAMLNLISERKHGS